MKDKIYLVKDKKGNLRYITQRQYINSKTGYQDLKIIRGVEI